MGKLRGMVVMLFVVFAFRHGYAVANVSTLNLIDTDLYMIGKIAVGIYFLPARDGKSNWGSKEEIDEAFVNACDAISQFAQYEPNAHLEFTFVKEVDEHGIPIPLQISLARQKANSLRCDHNTDWAFLVYITHGTSGVAYSNSMFSFSTPNGRSKGVLYHEMMHVFGALDNYYAPTVCAGPATLSGYLQGVNANSQSSNSGGFFGGRGEALPDVMLYCDRDIGYYSRVQIGWRDSDGDGILDPVDTFPHTSLEISQEDFDGYVITGLAKDMPLMNEASNEWGDVSINTIKNVHYRVNGGGWNEAQPSDGVFDSKVEQFSLSLPSLANGKYVVETRATNSVGNKEVSYAKIAFSVDGSIIQNVSPFATFSVVPDVGSIRSTFVCDASDCSDIEDKAATLSVRWDFDGDGVWDTKFSTTKVSSWHYDISGEKMIMLEVKDSAGATYITEKQIQVSPSNIPPKAFFTVTPAYYGDHWEVTFDAAGCFDAEDDMSNLHLNWDLDEDGIFEVADSRIRFTRTFTAPNRYTQYLRFTLQVVDSDGADSFATRDAVYIPYDHFPTLKELSISGEIEDVKLLGSFDGMMRAKGIDISEGYVYITDSNNSLLVVDVSKPDNACVVGSISLGGCAAECVFVSDGYAYVGTDKGLSVLDISSPANPQLVAFYGSTEGIRDIIVLGDYAYVLKNSAGIDVISIAVPSTPTLVGTCSTSGWGTSIHISGALAYVVTLNGCVDIVDVIEPGDPNLLASIKPGGHASGVFVSGSYAYVVTPLSGLEVYDVSSPVAPIMIGSCRACGGHDVYVHGDMVYIAANSMADTLYLVYAKDKTNPILAGTYRNGFDRSRSSLSARRAVDFSEGRIYVLNEYSGLDIWQVQSLQCIRAYATDLDAKTTWDGLLKYRWDFDTDGTWDTEFSEGNVAGIPAEAVGLEHVCEVRDRFGMTSRKTVGGPKNLLTNPDVNDGYSGWKRYGKATVEEFSANSRFTLRNKGYFYQDVSLPQGSQGKYALMVGSVSSERVNSNGSITGLPYLYGYMMKSDGKIAKYLQGMLGTPSEPNKWVTVYGIFPVPSTAIRVRFFLQQAERYKDPQNGSAARFDNLGLYIFDTEETAKAFMSIRTN